MSTYHFDFQSSADTPNLPRDRTRFVSDCFWAALRTITNGNDFFIDRGASAFS